MFPYMRRHWRRKRDLNDREEEEEAKYNEKRVNKKTVI
jgi:hypothetical protein